MIERLDHTIYYVVDIGEIPDGFPFIEHLKWLILQYSFREYKECAVWSPSWSVNVEKSQSDGR